MDLNNLRNNYHQLINQMEKDNYDILLMNDSFQKLNVNIKRLK